MSEPKKNLGTTTGLLAAWRAAGQPRTEGLEQPERLTKSAGLGTTTGLLAEWRKHAPKAEAHTPQAQKPANKTDDQTNDLMEHL